MSQFSFSGSNIIGLLLSAVTIVPLFLLFFLALYKEQKLSFGPLAQEALALKCQQARIEHLQSLLEQAAQALESTDRKIEQFNQGLLEKIRLKQTLMRLLAEQERHRQPSQSTELMALKDSQTILDTRIEIMKTTHEIRDLKQSQDTLLNQRQGLAQDLRHLQDQLSDETLKPSASQTERLTVNRIQLSAVEASHKGAQAKLLTRKEKLWAGILSFGKAIGWASASLSIILGFKGLLALAGTSLSLSMLGGPVAVAITTISLVLLVATGGLIAACAYKKTKREMGNLIADNLTMTQDNQEKMSAASSYAIGETPKVEGREQDDPVSPNKRRHQASILVKEKRRPMTPPNTRQTASLRLFPLTPTSPPKGSWQPTTFDGGIYPNLSNQAEQVEPKEWTSRHPVKGG